MKKKSSRRKPRTLAEAIEAAESKPNKKLRELMRSVPQAFAPLSLAEADLINNAELCKAPGTKPTNPKDALGILKVPASTVSAPVVAELGVAMLEGALKYGRHNYRVIGVRASVYYDATRRHIDSWWEGEDTDPDSKLSHITKAIASLVVLRDAMIQDKMIDDRPPRSPDGWMVDLNARVKELLAKYPNPAECYTEEGERRKAGEYGRGTQTWLEKAVYGSGSEPQRVNSPNRDTR